VVVHLGNGVAVAVQAFLAPLVGFLNTLVGVRSIGADPSHQGRTHVETHKIVVVDNVNNTALGAQNTACRIGTITLTSNTVIPVMKGARAGLVLDNASPGVFTRRLVKVTVDRKIKGVLLFHVGKDRKRLF